MTHPGPPSPPGSSAGEGPAAATPVTAGAGWRHPLFDLGAFGLGLALAGLLGWHAGDLVWSLWLASLVLGYATIVLGIAGSVAAAVVAHRHVLPAAVSGVFLLAFFTVHFGMFHFVHSMFLRGFFPLGEGASTAFEPAWSDYGIVGQRYWPWLLAAGIAERGALLEAWNQARCAPPPTEPRPGGGQLPEGFNPMRAYINVVRLHLLIFFFAFASLSGLDHFAVFAVVYAVYFFPWRLAFARLRRSAA